VVRVSGGAHRAETDPADVKRIRTASLPVGPASLDAVRLVSPELIQQARLLLAGAALHPDGASIDELDPADLTGSSIYLGTQSGEGRLTGCIRLVGLGEAADRLPTVKMLRGLPFLQGAQVVEVAALGRTDDGDAFTGTAKLLLAAFCEADRNGCDYLVMSVAAEVSALVEALLGTSALKGVSAQGVGLIPCYVDLHTCLDEALEYLRHQSDATSRSVLALFEDVQRFRRGR